MTGFIQHAKELGFDEASTIKPRILQSREDVRGMCAADKCGAYGKNWTCPPACGTLEQCQKKMNSYHNGLLLQTVGHMTKDIDSRCYRETEKKHNEALRVLWQTIKNHYPEALCLGAGGCRICKKCTYPEPCRFPDKAMPSMEAYGLFVTQVCKDAGIDYHHGERTITYTACILF